LSSCSDDKKDEPKLSQTKTSYTITSDLGVDKLAGEHAANASLTLLCLEYNDRNELINTQTWDNVKDGAKKMFNANQRCVKVVIRIEVNASANGQSAKLIRYVSTIYYLELNKGISIKLDSSTRINSFNPID